MSRIEKEIPVDRKPRITPGPAYWLIVENDNGGPMEVLTFGRRGHKMLPIFSFEDEAEMFLRFEVTDDGWKVRESGAGELVSVLHGPCADVEEVALDPLPEMLAEGTVGLVSLPRESFLDRIVVERTPVMRRRPEPRRGRLSHGGGLEPKVARGC